MMRWLLLGVLTAAACVTLATALAVPASTDAMRLVGTTGPGHRITLKRGRKDVDYLKPGRYAISVRDRSSRHGFILDGRTATGRFVGPIKITSLRFVGNRTVTVTLARGLYVYYCPAHASLMRGQFRTD